MYTDLTAPMECILGGGGGGVLGSEVFNLGAPCLKCTETKAQTKKI